MSSRLKHIRLFISVLATVSAIAIITILLVAYGQGYIYDYESGEITSGGLALVDSRPSGSDVWINGNHEGTTSDRFRLPAKGHHISIDTEGYRQWQRSFSVGESEVVNLEYPLLVPERVVTSPSLNMNKPTAGATNLPSGQVALAFDDPIPHVRVFPSDAPDDQDWVLAIMSGWRDVEISSMDFSGSGNSLLVGANDSNTSSRWFHITIDDAGYEALDINAAFDIETEKVQFGASSTSLVAQSEEGLYQLDTETLDQRDFYQGQLDSFAVDGSGVLYLSRHVADQTELIRQTGLGTQQVINTFTGQRSLSLDTLRWQDSSNLLVHDKDRSQLSIYSLLDSERPQTKTFPAGSASSFTSSPNGRFIHQYSADQVRLYDMRREKESTFTLNSEPDILPVWINQSYLATVVDQELIMLDYDGSNQEYLAYADPVFIFATPDVDEVYSFRDNQHNELQLQSSSLTSGN